MISCKSRANLSLKKTKRIAVLVPIEYRGDRLRSAKLLAQALLLGSQQAEESVEVVFGYIENSPDYKEELRDLPEDIQKRTFNFRTINQAQAARALIYADKECHLASDYYIVPEDNMKQFTDCDLWIIISDRIGMPILPIRPYILMVYDYLQRYEIFLSSEENRMFISAAHAAECILVTTKFTQQDAIHFAGLPENKVHKLPILAPNSTKKISCDNQEDMSYFIWATNLDLHKNHENALKALQIYYEQYDGQLLCKITGIHTDNLLDSPLPHLQNTQKFFKKSAILKKKLEILGELSHFSYQNVLANAQFLWHAARIDNGTFSVIEAAHLGVPALSSNYPAMKEIDEQFKLNLSWMRADDAEDMAYQLKQMELEGKQKKNNLPSLNTLAQQSVEKLANHYWITIRDYL